MTASTVSGTCLGRCYTDCPPVETYGDGRICAAPGCTTILSRYNSELTCSLHAHVRVASERIPRDLVPIENAVAAIEKLKRRGWTCTAIGRATGLKDSTVRSVVSGYQLTVAAATSSKLCDLAKSGSKPESRKLDAGPVRARIAKLSAQGMSYAEISRKAGIEGHSTVRQIVSRVHQYVYNDIAERILSIPCDEDKAPEERVSAGPVRAHVDALRAAGMSLSQIARAAGYDHRHVVQDATRQTVRTLPAERAARILAVPIPEEVAQ